MAADRAVKQSAALTMPITRIKSIIFIFLISNLSSQGEIITLKRISPYHASPGSPPLWQMMNAAVWMEPMISADGESRRHNGSAVRPQSRQVYQAKAMSALTQRTQSYQAGAVDLRAEIAEAHRNSLGSLPSQMGFPGHFECGFGQIIKPMVKPKSTFFHAEIKNVFLSRKCNRRIKISLDRGSVKC